MTERDATATPPPVRLMAVATGVAVAAIYLNQPLLVLIGSRLHAARLAELVATATQLGYAAGILLLVPLGDQVERRWLILWQGAALVVALLTAAAAPGFGTLLVASLGIGIAASLAQQVVPFAAELASLERRGRTVGTVMSGLLLGILLGRVASGLLADRFGWRAVFAFDAGLTAVVLVAVRCWLPRSSPAPARPYGALLWSLVGLLRDERALRRAALTQGMLFAGFSVFWTALPFLLGGSPFRLGAGTIGAFGILAAGGVLVAPMAGHAADRAGPDRVVRRGAVLVMAAFALMAPAVFLAHAAGPRFALVVLGAGVVLMDCGIQMAMIGNQSIIYGRAGAARGRFNTVLVTAMFLLGACGSAASGPCRAQGGWLGAMILAVLLAAAAVLVQSAGRRDARIAPDAGAERA